MRNILYLNYTRYCGFAPVNLPDKQMITAQAEKLASDELVLIQQSGAKAPGKDAVEQPQIQSGAKAYAPPPAPALSAANILADNKKQPSRDYKIVIEVAGAQLTQCCHDRLVSAAVGPRREPVDYERMTTLADMGKDKHRHEVVIAGLTRDPRALYINPGCNEAGDAANLIPLHTKVRPVEKDTQRDQWPTALVSVAPLAFTDAAKTPDRAMPLRSGRLYLPFCPDRRGRGP